MNETTATILFLAIVFIIVIIVVVVIIRWVFRIDEIVAYLKRIADKLAPSSSACECCHKIFRSDNLIKIDSGQNVCPGCKKIINSH